MYSNPPMNYPYLTPSSHQWSIPPTYPTNPSFTTPITPSFPSFPWELFTPYYTHASSSPKLYLNHGYSPHSHYSYPWNIPTFYPNNTTLPITSQNLDFNGYPLVSPQQHTCQTPPSPWMSLIPNPKCLVKRKLRQLSLRVAFLLSVRKVYEQQ